MFAAGLAESLKVHPALPLPRLMFAAGLTESLTVHPALPMPGLVFSAGLAESLKVIVRVSASREGKCLHKLALPFWSHRNWLKKGRACSRGGMLQQLHTAITMKPEGL